MANWLRCLLRPFGERDIARCNLASDEIDECQYSPRGLVARILDQQSLTERHRMTETFQRARHVAQFCECFA